MTRAGVVAVLIAAVPAPAAAGPDSEVASAFDAGDKLDVHVSLDYRYTVRRSAIKRELVGLDGADPDGPIPLVKDLVFAGARHELVPRLELGVFTDAALTASLPIVLRDVRTLAFDQRADDCVYPVDPGAATCIDRSNSTTTAQAQSLPRRSYAWSHPRSSCWRTMCRATPRFARAQSARRPVKFSAAIARASAIACSCACSRTPTTTA